MTWQIQRLTKKHDRSQFAAGSPLLDDWLKLRAGQFDRRDLARTYVAVEPDTPLVCGYYAIANHLVRYDALPTDQAKGLPSIDVPVVLLGRLAVHRPMQGRGLGKVLLIDALRRSLSLADQIGIRAVEVDAVDDAAVHFYRKFGFLMLLDDPRHLLLPMNVVRQLPLSF